MFLKKIAPTELQRYGDDSFEKWIESKKVNTYKYVSFLSYYKTSSSYELKFRDIVKGKKNKGAFFFQKHPSKMNLNINELLKILGKEDDVFISYKDINKKVTKKIILKEDEQKAKEQEIRQKKGKTLAENIEDKVKIFKSDREEKTKKYPVEYTTNEYFVLFFELLCKYLNTKEENKFYLNKLESVIV